MRIYLGTDHRGFELKEQIKSWLVENGYEVEDVGAYQFNPDDDYIDFGLKVAESIEGNDSASRGILVCGSGHGMDMVANRFPHVRAILGFTDAVTIQGREHEDANVLVVPSDWISVEEAIERIRLFLETEANMDARHVRRRAKIAAMQIRKA